MQIDLTGCNTVSDAAMHGLCSGSPHLENVCLRQCFRVGKSALAYMSKLSSLRRLVLDRVIAITSSALADFAARSWESHGGSRSQLHTMIESYVSELGRVQPHSNSQISAHSSRAGTLAPPAPGQAECEMVIPPLPRAHLAEWTATQASAAVAADPGVLLFDFSQGSNEAAAGPPHQQQEVIDWDDAQTSPRHKTTARRLDDYHWDESASMPLHTGSGKPASAAPTTHSTPPDRRERGLPVLPLTHFDVSNCLKVASLDGVFAAARRLTHVNLAGCPNISSASVGILGVTCGDTLRHVNLSGCHNITDTGVQTLALRCPGLLSLMLNKCRNAANDATLGVISEGCPQLARLGLNSCVHVSDAGLAHIGTMHNLSYLDIEFCHTVSDDGLQHVLEGCRGIEDVNLRMLVRLSATSMHAIAIKWPHLRRLRVGGIDTPANLSRLVRPISKALPSGQLHVSW